MYMIIEQPRKRNRLDLVPIDILYLISSFIVTPQYRLRDEIKLSNLVRERLYVNPRAFRYLLEVYHSTSLPWSIWCNHSNEDALLNLFQQPRFIYWPTLLMNEHPIAVSYILSHPKQIDWKYACINANDRMVDRLVVTLDEMVWNTKDCEWWKKWNRLALNTNSRIVSMIQPHASVFFPLIWKNTNPMMIAYLWEHHATQVSWMFLSQNPSDEAMDILFRHMDQIDWVSVNENPNDRMVDYLIDHPERMSIEFSKNKHPRALSYLLAHPERINWYHLSDHPDLFIKDEERTMQEIIHWTKQTLN